jgi:hypothetical protein
MVGLLVSTSDFLHDVRQAMLWNDDSDDDKDYDDIPQTAFTQFHGELRNLVFVIYGKRIISSMDKWINYLLNQTKLLFLIEIFISFSWRKSRLSMNFSRFSLD